MSVYEIEAQKTIEDSFLKYSSYVILFRSIPDARDLLKYSTRQLLYSQFKNKIIHPAEKRKATVSVGDAMKEFYVHGDAPCYGTFVRMAKPFAMRYPLEDSKGNVGTLVDPENHSQARYVELRGSELATELFTSLNKDTIGEWRDNYDQTTKFPMVLPSIGFYNIVNGVAGIATGISTSIPQFNLREVNKALITLLNNPNSTFDELYCPIDFATGGIIINEDEVKESLRIGNGKSARIRAKIEYDEKKHQLIVVEMPYSVYTNTICSQLQELIEKEPNCGIENFIDATGKSCDLRINLTKKASPNRVIDWLYKNTSLQNYYSINMIMLEGGKNPKLFGWVSALQSHLDHSKIVKKRELEFDLNKATARLHIVEGYLIALANITEIVEIIKKSSSASEATKKLMSRFELSETQCKAILDLKLSRLVNMEAIKVQSEKDELFAEISRLNNILCTPTLFNKEIEKELDRISKKFGDSRRTINMNLKIGDNNEPIEKKILMVYFSEFGSVQAQEVEQYAVQLRGGKGSKVKLREGDFIKETVYADNGSWVLVFTSKGKVHTFYLNDLEVGVEHHIQTLLDFEPNEKVMSILPYSKAKNYSSILIGTKNGFLKKTPINEYISKNKKPITAIKLRDGDSIASVAFVLDGDEVLVVSEKGNCIRIDESDIPSTGRSTMGVQGIRLDSDNKLLDVLIINKETKEICSITTSGLVKRTKVNEFSKTNRATKGVKIQSLKDGDEVVAVASVSNEKEIMAVSLTNVIRIALSQVPQTSRNTFGVSVMKNPVKITKIVLLNS